MVNFSELGGAIGDLDCRFGVLARVLLAAEECGAGGGGVSVNKLLGDIRLIMEGDWSNMDGVDMSEEEEEESSWEEKEEQDEWGSGEKRLLLVFGWTFIDVIIGLVAVKLLWLLSGVFSLSVECSMVSLGMY